MERIRSRLLDERAGIKKAEEKRKERATKKFGKQVQLEKQREREKGKKDMEERLKSLKRSRLRNGSEDMQSDLHFHRIEHKGALDNQDTDGEAFDIAVEDAISDRPTAKRAKSQGSSSKQGGPPKGKHAVGGKRTAGGKRTGGNKRPGKSKRIASRSRR